MSPRTSRGTLRPRRAVAACALLVLALMGALTLRCAGAAPYETVTVQLWMSGQAAGWSEVLSGVFADSVTAAAAQDITVALQNSDIASSSSRSSSNVMSYTDSSFLVSSNSSSSVSPSSSSSASPSSSSSASPSSSSSASSSSSSSASPSSSSSASSSSSSSASPSSSSSASPSSSSSASSSSSFSTPSCVCSCPSSSSSSSASSEGSYEEDSESSSSASSSSSSSASPSSSSSASSEDSYEEDSESSSCPSSSSSSSASPSSSSSASSEDSYEEDSESCSSASPSSSSSTPSSSSSASSEGSYEEDSESSSRASSSSSSSTPSCVCSCPSPSSSSSASSSSSSSASSEDSYEGDSESSFPASSSSSSSAPSSSSSASSEGSYEEDSESSSRASSSSSSSAPSSSSSASSGTNPSSSSHVVLTVPTATPRTGVSGLKKFTAMLRTDGSGLRTFTGMLRADGGSSASSHVVLDEPTVTLRACTSKNTAGPVYGALMQIVVNTTRSAAEVEAAVRASSFSALNDYVRYVFSDSAVGTMRVNAPDAMTAVVADALLPLSGSTFLWELVWSATKSAGVAVDIALTGPLQADIQNAVDPSNTSFLAVATSDYVTNASSSYVPYQVWAYPGVSVSTSVMRTRGRAAVVTASTTTTASALTALVMESTLPRFNDRLDTLVTLLPEVRDYISLLPRPVLPWTPLPGNPFDGSSSSTDSSLEVYGNITGSYLLNFAGDVDTWTQVLANERNSLVSTIESAITTELHRRTFRNTVMVTDAQIVPTGSYQITGLQVTCQVVQGVTPSSDHPWTPEELASMLLQASYSATEALYNSNAGPTGMSALRKSSAARKVMALAVDASVTPGSLASTGIQYDFHQRMGKAPLVMIAMACLIGLSCLIAVIVAVSCCCCCRPCIDDPVPPSRSEEGSAHSPFGGGRGRGQPFDDDEDPPTRPVRVLKGYEARRSKHPDTRGIVSHEPTDELRSRPFA